MGFNLTSTPIGKAFAEGHDDNPDSSSNDQKSSESNNSTNNESEGEHRAGNTQVDEKQNRTGSEHENESENKTMSEHQEENKTMIKSEGEMDNQHRGETDAPEEIENQNNNEKATHPVTEQDISHIKDAKTNQTIAAEVEVGDGNINQKSLDNNVLVKTENSTNDAVNITVSATNQTGPKVILVNLNSTTIDVSSIKYLHVLYDGHPISPATDVNQILHTASSDEPHYAILITQNGAQILISIPHFSTHTITLGSISKVMPVIPEFPLSAVMVFASITALTIAITRKRNLYIF